MHQATRAVRRLMPLAVLGIASCASLGRDSPPLEQYVLGAGQPPAAAPAPAAGVASISIGVRRLALAAYLNTPAMVVRQGANRIVVSDFHRWGEELGEGINRQVARHLAGAPAVRAVDIAPWPVRTLHDYLVHLDVARFEGVADALAVEGGARIVASWQIIRPGDGAILARGETDWEQSGWVVGDYAALALLLDNGIADMAGEVLTCLARVQATPLPATGAEPPTAITCP